jgi:hypothetical protein
VSESPSAARGQASVELVALLPLLALVAALAWQAVVAGQALWLAGAAARAAARAQAVGGDRGAAVRAVLPPRLEQGMSVRDRSGGGVEVALRVPSVLSAGSLTTVRREARFPSQSP